MICREDQIARMMAMRQQCRADIRRYVKGLKLSEPYALQPAMRVLLGSEIPFEMNSILATSVVDLLSSLRTTTDRICSSPFQSLSRCGSTTSRFLPPLS